MESNSAVSKTKSTSRSTAAPQSEPAAIASSASKINASKESVSETDRDQANESSKPKRKHISVKIDRANRARAGHQCEYSDPETGVRCSARRHLETEHKISVVHGGDDSPENLQLYCAAHNKLKAAQQLGFDFMAGFVPSLH